LKGLWPGFKNNGEKEKEMVERETLRFLEEEVQYIALSIMAIVYIGKVIWLLRKASLKDRANLKGNRLAGAMVSMGNIFMPWAMESTRIHWYFYIEFLIFHIGVALTILSTFLIPLKVMNPKDTLSTIIMVSMGLAFIVGMRRFIRRITKKELRIISSPDDYFAILILNIFFLSGIWALGTGNTTALFIFFAMTTFFLLYVPFSKISHYIIYPFSRWYYGTHFGGRGVLIRMIKTSD
jgi:nitrate reductase gamma subunit